MENLDSLQVDSEGGGEVLPSSCVFHWEAKLQKGRKFLHGGVTSNLHCWMIPFHFQCQRVQETERLGLTLAKEAIFGCKYLNPLSLHWTEPFESSDWTLDLTHPKVDVNEGWQYARSFDDPDDQWTAEPPSTLLRVLAGNGVLTPALTGVSSSNSAQPMNIANGKQAVNHDNTTWVRRRRWIRVLRRRLDIPPLPFLQADGLRYYLSAEGTLIPAEDDSHAMTTDGNGQELGTFSTEMGGQDYVSRARYLAGTQRKGSISIGLLDSNGAGVDGEVVSAADLKRAIGRLERATIELRSGMLGEPSVFLSRSYLTSYKVMRTMRGRRKPKSY